MGYLSTVLISDTDQVFLITLKHALLMERVIDKLLCIDDLSG